MIRYLILLTLTTAWTMNAWSVNFNLQPIEQQIKDSDGLFEGNFLKSKVVLLEDGSVATQMIFKMNKEVGLQSDFYGMDEIIVHYPGGRYEGKETGIHELPEFVSGEKVLLFIRNVDNRYWGLNLSFGSFKVINYGNEVMLVNSVFPQHPQVGQVRWEYFEKAVKRIKGFNLKRVYSMEYQLSIEKKLIERTPASEEGQGLVPLPKAIEPEAEAPAPIISVFWLIMILGMTGGIFRLNTLRTSK